MGIQKSEVKAIHEKVSKAVAEVLKTYGYKLGKDSCRYSDFDMKFSIEAVKNDPTAMAERARQMFRFMFEDYGIDFGTVVTDRTGKRKFSVDGFNRAGKLGGRDSVDGKVYYGKPEIFYLNGKPLMDKWSRVQAEKASAPKVETRPVSPAKND